MKKALQSAGLDALWHCPQLNTSPKQAIEQCQQLIRAHHDQAQPLIVMGSSLGGFYATYLAEQWPSAKAVVLNPVVYAARDLAHYVGTLSNFHTGATFDFSPDDVQALAKLEVDHLTDPTRYMLIAATGDELLDWREMAAHYEGAQQTIISGGDHGLSDFPQYLDKIFTFLGLPTPATPTAN